MNNINTVAFHFEYPLFLLLIIPAIVFALYHFFKLPKSRRVTINRIVSLVIHFVVVILVCVVLSGFYAVKTNVSIKKDVILLVDESASMEHNQADVDTCIKNILDEASNEFEIGIVTYGYDQVYLAKMSNKHDAVYSSFKNQKTKPEMSATNIEEALLFAKSQLSNPLDGRIILLTDGTQTDGVATKAVSSIANMGTRIDTIFFSPISKSDEVKIAGISLKNDIQVGIPTNVELTLQSRKSCNANVKLYVNNEEVKSVDISLSSGLQTLGIDHTFNNSGVYEIKAVIDSQTDTILENNIAYSYVNIDYLNKVLIIQGTGSKPNNLVNLIKDDYTVEVKKVNEVVASVDEMRNYNQVILLNTKASELEATGLDEVLNVYVKTYGGGLLNVAGDDSYDDSMQGSLFESMLPVRVSEEPNPVSIMLVIDRSSSMGSIVPGLGVSIMEVAKNAASACVGVLKDSDYIGIVEFDADADLFMGLTPATQKQEIYEKIATMTVGYGTAYKKAVELAGEELKSSTNTNLKHIIFVSDGAPIDTGYVEAVKALGDGVTLSAIAIGDNQGDGAYNPQALKDMAKAGNGRFYNSKTGYDLQSIMLAETEIALNQKINNEVFKPVIDDVANKAIMGINELPDLLGYYGSLATKKKAETILSKEGNPVLATWEYGLGTISCFNADLDGKFTELYFEDAKGTMFIKNLVKSVEPLVSSRNHSVDVDFENKNYTTELTITTSSSNQNLKVKVISPSFKEENVTVEKITDRINTGSFTSKESGLYKVIVSRLSSTNEVIQEEEFYFAFSYSQEYDAFYNESVCLNKTKELAKYGKGNVIEDITGMFNLENQVYDTIINPTNTLIIIAIVLFLSDIAFRKFKIKTKKEKEK